MKGTDDVLKFGDMIVLDATSDEENEDAVTHRHLECKFIPEMVDILLEQDIIEEHEVEDDDTSEESMYPDIEELLEANEDLELRVEKLEEKVRILAAAIAAKLTDND